MKDNLKKRIKTMDIILAILLTCMVIFIVTMIWVFMHMGSTPDTLIVSVFAFFGLECGIMGWIKTTKTKLEGMLYGEDHAFAVNQCDNDVTLYGSSQEDDAEG